MKQKIIKIGNSQGIIIPKEALDAAKLKVGEEVYITPDPNADTLILSEKKIDNNYARNMRFRQALNEVNEKYKGAWIKLANKKDE